MKRTLMGLLWIQVTGIFSYACVILALVYGFGLQPKSWIWIIIGYALANNMWVCVVMARENLLKVMGFMKEEEKEEQ